MSSWIAAAGELRVVEGEETLLTLSVTPPSSPTGDRAGEPAVPAQTAGDATDQAEDRDGQPVARNRTGATRPGADAAVAAELSALTVPRGETAVRDATTGAVTDLPAGTSLQLPSPDGAAERHVVTVDVGASDHIGTAPGALLVLRVGAGVCLEHDGGSTVSLALDEPARVTLAFHAGDVGTVSIPPTPAGAAAAVTAAARRHPTATAARSLPGLRATPPTIRLLEGAESDPPIETAVDGGRAGPAAMDDEPPGTGTGATAAPAGARESEGGDGTGLIHDVLVDPAVGGTDRADPPNSGLADGSGMDSEAAASGSRGRASGRTGGELSVVVPPTFESVLEAASLAFYLGATLTTTPGARPHLSADWGRVALGEDGPTPADEVVASVSSPGALLERVLWLDALVREAGSPHAPPAIDLLADLDVEPSALRDRPPAVRLQRYLEVPYEDVAGELPEWHVATYADPSAERVPALTGVLEHLSHVHPPVSHELSGRELMERTLDDFYRDGGVDGHDTDHGGTAGAGGGSPDEGTGSIRARTPVDVVRPELREGQLHAWAAAGTPLDVYKLLPGATRDDRGRHDGSDRTITVVHNEAEMRAEGVDAAAAYRDASHTAVRSVEGLACEELRAEFERGPDLLHFVGHCDEAGLRCADGHLSATDIDAVDVDAVFLNACGSYHEGVALVEAGVRATGVTFRKVLDGQARTVGTTFARLYAAGFPIDRAVELARRRIVMGKDYAVVGDGTHTMFPRADHCPIVLSVACAGGTETVVTAGNGESEAGATTADDEAVVAANGYEIACDGAGVPGVGGTYCPPHHDDGARRLRGARAAATIGHDELVSLLDDADLPVRHDEGFAWSDDLAARLRAADPA